MDGRTLLRSVAMISVVGGSALFAAQSLLVSQPGQAATAPVIESAAPRLTVAAADISASAAPSRSAPTPASFASPAPVVAPEVPLPPTPTPFTHTAQTTVSPAPAPLPLPEIAETANVRLPGDTVAEAEAAAPQNVSIFGLPCGLTLSVEPLPGAMAGVNLMDPCQPYARVEITHGPLHITAETDAMGLLTFDIPGFESPAFVTARLPDGQATTAMTGLPDLNDFDRAAIVWTEDRQLELHALEFGAEMGGPGHVWEGAPGDLAAVMEGRGGHLMELGAAHLSDARLAQVYTYPRSGPGRSDGVRLSIDAPITSDTCGQAVEAQGLQSQPGGQPLVTDIRLTLPDCDATGGYLVLQNVFQDLRLAAN